MPDAHAINRSPLHWIDAAAVRVEIEKAHNDLVDHGGVLVTLQRMLRRVAPYPSRKLMLQNIDAFCKGCPGCQKMRKRSTHSAVHRRVIRRNPFEELSVDIVTLPFPEARENRYIVTVVDNVSHWVSVFAQRIVNASFHSAIGASPAQLIFGGNLDLDRCILARPSVRAATAVPSYVDELSDTQLILFEAAEEHQTPTQAKIIAKVQRAMRANQNVCSNQTILSLFCH